MSRIRIKNFGPIKEGYLEDDGWMDISKVTMFIGNQGSGKSTVAKVISTLLWLEKAINRGDVKGLNFQTFENFFEYQRIKSYFKKKDTIIDYEGERINICYNPQLNTTPIIEEKRESNYSVPQIMYIPAERNFLSVVKNAYEVTNIPESLDTFSQELLKCQKDLRGNLITLPISELKYKYNEEEDSSYILGEDFELNLLEASSGLQSFIPMYLVTKFLSDELFEGEKVLLKRLTVKQRVRKEDEINSIMFDDTISDKEKDKKEKEINAKYLNSCLLNIVEEPEQNLYPSS